MHEIPGKCRDVGYVIYVMVEGEFQCVTHRKGGIQSLRTQFVRERLGIGSTVKTRFVQRLIDTVIPAILQGSPGGISSPQVAGIIEASVLRESSEAWQHPFKNQQRESELLLLRKPVQGSQMLFFFADHRIHPTSADSGHQSQTPQELCACGTERSAGSHARGSKAHLLCSINPGHLGVPSSLCRNVTRTKQCAHGRSQCIFTRTNY